MRDGLIFLFITIGFLTVTFADELADSVENEPSPGPSYSVLSYDNPDPSRRNTREECNRFIAENGELGDWGRLLIESIRRNVEISNCFFGNTNSSVNANNADFSRLCPRFTDFNDDRKEQFIAFLFASMSAYESNCNHSMYQRVGGPNGTLIGMFQLELEHHLRRIRPTECSPRDRSLNRTQIASAEYQLSCAAAIFNQVYCTEFTGRTQGERIVGVMRGGYWQDLNGSRGGEFRRISRMASQFPGCYE